jgi:hypothetical protein
MDLAKIRSVVLFATPNHGATILSNLRGILFATPNRGATSLSSLCGIFSKFRQNPQEDDLKVLSENVAGISDVIKRCILEAERVDEGHCPIPFRVFWGNQDDVVPKVSARGSFIEASPLPGGHSGIINNDPHDPDPDDTRYQALKGALLNPVGHPSTYEIDLFEVRLKVSPIPPQTKTLTRDNGKIKLSVQTDNVAIHTRKIVFSKQNRRTKPYKQVYESDNGLVELLGLTEPNEASDLDQSNYYKKGQRFTYVFKPDREKTFLMTLRIYHGFAEEQRKWHNHMKPDACYRLFRFILDLEDYQKTDYKISQDPNMYFHPQDVMDHELCEKRGLGEPLPCLQSPVPWLRTWEIQNVKGGVVDLVWNVQRPA